MADIIFRIPIPVVMVFEVVSGKKTPGLGAC
jgi:hypothetical protein